MAGENPWPPTLKDSPAGPQIKRVNIFLHKHVTDNVDWDEKLDTKVKFISKCKVYFYILSDYFK